MSDSDVAVHRTVPALEIHKIDANIILDEHGLSPYYGVVSAFEPGEDTERDPFEALGINWSIESSTYWTGKIADPQGNHDDGLYEYRYKLLAEDEVGDREAVVAFRPGFPEAKHVDTGNRIQSIPTQCPESLRVEVTTVNVNHDDILELLRDFFDAMGLNPDYVCEPHEWSRITGFEGYVRVDRDASEAHLTSEGGIIQQLAQFGSSKGDRGEHKWDHEKVQGHYEAVALDAGSWGLLMPEQSRPKRLKSYHPEHPRSETDDSDDPLYHPKLEVQLWRDESDPVPWDQFESLLDEFHVCAANALHWSGVGLDADSEAFVPDGYHAAGWSDSEVPIIPNPIPKVKEELTTDARDHLSSPEISRGEFAVVEAKADGGVSHYHDLAEAANVSPSTVYRAVDKLPFLETDNGEIVFPERVTRDRVVSLIERWQKLTDPIRDNLRDVAQGLGRLTSGSGEPSALERWMDNHAAVVADRAGQMHFRFDGQFSEHEIVEILRSGYHKARQSGLESDFRDALVTYTTADGDRRKAWKVIMQRGGRDSILGRWPLRA